MSAEPADSGMKHIARSIIVVALLAFIGAGLTLGWPKDALKAATVGLMFAVLGIFF